MAVSCGTLKAAVGWTYCRPTLSIESAFGRCCLFAFTAANEIPGGNR
jgi:hypothetical protein